MTDGSIIHIKPERVKKISFKKYIYFYLFKIQPFINFLSFFFLLLSLAILTSGACATCFFLIYPKASTIWIPHLQMEAYFLFYCLFLAWVPLTYINIYS